MGGREKGAVQRKGFRDLHGGSLGALGNAELHMCGVRFHQAWQRSCREAVSCLEICTAWGDANVRDGTEHPRHPAKTPGRPHLRGRDPLAQEKAHSSPTLAKTENEPQCDQTDSPKLTAC